jgi:hypothetical protein
MAAVETQVVTVRAWNGIAEVAKSGIANQGAPLAGFSVIEAADLSEVIELVAKTPCARAKGAIEIRPIMFINDQQWRSRHQAGSRFKNSPRGGKARPSGRKISPARENPHFVSPGSNL